MKFKIDNKYVKIGITAFLVVAACICFYYLIFRSSSISNGFHTIISICMPIIDGLVLAYILTPVVNGIEKHIIFPAYQKQQKSITPKCQSGIRVISIICTIILVILVMYAFFAMVIPQLIRSIQSIIFQFPIYVNNLTIYVEDLLKTNPDIEQSVTKLLNDYSSNLTSWMNESVIPKINAIVMTISLSVLSIFKALWNFIIGFIISVYVLASKEKFAGQAKKVAFAFFEESTANHIISNFRFVHRTFIGFISGKLVDSLIIGILCFIGTSFMKTPYAVLISVIVGVTNVIPFFGPYFGAIPSALLILMVNPLKSLYFLIFILILQQLDGNVIGPKILGDSTGLTGFWVIFSITIFGGLWGVFGMIVGVPIFAVLYAGFRVIINRKLKQKQLPTNSDPYMKVDYIKDTDFHDIPDEDKPNKKNGQIFNKLISYFKKTKEPHDNDK